jgi:hypothetical protein
MSAADFSGRGVVVNDDRSPMTVKVRDIATEEIFECVLMVGRGGSVTAAMPNFTLAREIEAHRQTKPEADERARQEARERVIGETPNVPEEEPPAPSRRKKSETAA